MCSLILISTSYRFTHNMLAGKSGTIQVERGTASITTITKAKTGNLLVVKIFVFIEILGCKIF